MALDSEKIRHEIRRILKSGQTRSKDLADQVIRKVGSEKTVYREIKAMCDSGEIKKNESNRANITYELADLSKEIEIHQNKMNRHIDEILEYINQSREKLDSKNTFPGQALSVMVTAIRELQKFEARLKILSYFPAFKKTKQFEEIHLKSNNVWDEIFHLIAHQDDKNLINELMLNFPYIRHIYAK